MGVRFINNEIYSYWRNVTTSEMVMRGMAQKTLGNTDIEVSIDVL